MKIEKREGMDWVVTVRVPDDDELYPVTVFGVATETEAIADGLASFGVTPADPRGYEVVGVESDS